MKKVARSAGESGLVPRARAYDAPPVPGPFSLIARSVGRFFRAASRTSAEGAEIRRQNKPGSGAHRSAIDAGITGGFSFLAGGSPNGRRRA